MSELDLAGEHAKMTIGELVDRAQLDVVRNGQTETIAVKQLLHGVHDKAPTAAKQLPQRARDKTPAAARSVINPAMSVDGFRHQEQARLQQRAKHELRQQRYLDNGGAPKADDYW